MFLKIKDHPLAQIQSQDTKICISDPKDTSTKHVLDQYYSVLLKFPQPCHVE